jgi:hypothetical protein
MLRQWMKMASPLSPARIQRELYWVLTSAFNSLSACLAGILVPWLAVFRFKKLSTLLLDLWKSIPPSYRFALALSLAGLAWLNPYYSYDGSLQTGWVPVGAGMICWLMVWLSHRPLAEQSKVIRSTLLLGLAPWAAFNLLLTAGLMSSPRLKEQLAMSQGNLQRIVNGQYMSLGLGAFPWIQISILVGLTILYRKKIPIPAADYSQAPIFHFAQK